MGITYPGFLIVMYEGRVVSYVTLVISVFLCGVLKEHFREEICGLRVMVVRVSRFT